ncbi:hypothetical protein CRUP_003930 [Coryphaenoides rupestris]|nr:hypothetical protein CRUP_003930 [Coryphaenoides rupestris]
MSLLRPAVLSLDPVALKVSNTSLTKSLKCDVGVHRPLTCIDRNRQGSNRRAGVGDYVVTEETRLILFCEAPSAPPVVSYTWTKTRTGAGQAVVWTLTAALPPRSPFSLSLIMAVEVWPSVSGRWNSMVGSGLPTAMQTHWTPSRTTVHLDSSSSMGPQRYWPAPWGVTSKISSTESSSAVMVSVGAGLPWVLQWSSSVEPSRTVRELLTTGSRGGTA